MEWVSHTNLQIRFAMMCRLLAGCHTAYTGVIHAQPLTHPSYYPPQSIPTSRHTMVLLEKVSGGAKKKVAAGKTMTKHVAIMATFFGVIFVLPFVLGTKKIGQ